MPRRVRRILLEMRAMIGWSLRFRLLILGIAAAAILVGATQLANAPVDTLPEFGPATVEIQTEALGLSATEVEQLITVPLEADLLHGVAFLSDIHSQSVPGLSSIVMTFERGTSVLRARQMVAERLTQAHALPNVSKPPAMLQPLSSERRVLMVGLSSKDVSLIEMSVLAHWTIRPRLLSVPGVANVAVWGQRDRQLQVLVDPKRLRERGVSLSEVIETAGNALWVSPLTFLDASTPGTGGFIDTENQRIGVQHIQPITSPEELGKVAVVRDHPIPGAKQLILSDVATIVEDHQPLIGDAVVDGGPGLALVIEKFPGADTLAVTRDVEATLAAMQPGLTGITIDTSLFRPASYLESAAGNVGLAAVVALALIVIVLVALGRRRAALISLVTVPLGIGAGAIVLVALGVNVNALVIAGLALAVGVVVDDAVIGADAADRRGRERRQDDHELSPVELILEATSEARGPLLYATLITGFAMIPAFLAGGVVGAFMPTFALAFGAAVLISMIVALTVTPALCYLLRAGDRLPRREPSYARNVRLAYSSLLTRFVDRTRAAAVGLGAAAILAAVIVGISVVPGVAKSPLPTFRDPNLLVQWAAAPGTSAPEMARLVGVVSGALRAVPGVKDVGGHVGRAILSDQVVDINSGELWLSLDPARDYDTTVAAVEQVLSNYPAFQRELTTYPAERVSAVLPQPSSDLTVRVFGQEQDVIDQQAQVVQAAVAKVDGVKSASIAQRASEPTLTIEVDIAKADAYGLKPGDIRRAATTLLSGIGVGSLFEDQKVFDVVVWGIPDVRQDVNAVADLPIDTPAGRQVRLGDVASVEVVDAPAVIERDGVFRYVDVAVTVANRDLASVARDLDSAIKSIAMPMEYRAEVVGNYAERLNSQAWMLAAAVMAAIAIYLLLQAAFQSWRVAALVFLTLPGGVVGGALLAFLFGGSPTLGTLFGFLLVVAIAARNGILLVSDIQRLERSGELTGNAAVLHAATERFPAVLATTVATILALAPFVLLGDRPGYEVVRPMVLVVIGGLVTATLQNLFILPTLYRRVGPSPEGDPSAAPVSETPALEPATA
jgi:Cu/Ag efflux pump CusA